MQNTVAGVVLTLAGFLPIAQTHDNLFAMISGNLLF